MILPDGRRLRLPLKRLLIVLIAVLLIATGNLPSLIVAGWWVLMAAMCSTERSV